MNRSKAQFFNSQVGEPWAAAEYTAEERRKIARMIDAAGVRPGMRVLQPGCGTGRLTVILADLLGPAGLVVAPDISPEMVAACLRRIAGRSNVRLMNTAIEDLDDDRDDFDLVICHNVYPHFDNKREVTKKLASLLRSSGKLVVSHFMNSAWINDLHRKTHPSVLNDLIPGSEEMERILSAAGFRIDVVQDDEQGYLLLATLR
ncbi:MAG: methyltransferase domain-containing protein [Desulfomonile tiedjei]|nr:methyltransferase domain-containing protein [Desulfomonile tiedjei]